METVKYTTYSVSYRCDGVLCFDYPIVCCLPELWDYLAVNLPDNAEGPFQIVQQSEISRRE